MKIRYFAWIKDITHKDYDLIDNNYPKNIDEIKLFLNKSYPDLKTHIKGDILRFAINMEYTVTNQKLDSKDEIAVFPPVSGG